MRVLKFVPAFFAFLLVGGQLPVAVQAWDCCLCSNPCKYGCTCRGTGHCSSCSGRSVDSVPSPVVVQLIQEQLLSTVTNYDVVEPLIDLTRVEKRVGGNLTLNLIDNTADRQEFSCHGPDGKHVGNTLFQLVHSYTEVAMKETR